MEYDDALRWLLSLPDFERTGEFAARPDVAPMRALLAALGDPHLGRPTVHIAGSKGKGSTAVICEQVLRAAGRRTGCYVSPHLHRYTERVRIDGQHAGRDAFAAAMTSVREAIDDVAPRFPGRAFLAFDALTAAAFVTFRASGVDTQVVEVGLGGLLDSTNVFDASDVVVLTPISLEHTAVLGATMAEIAAQKAGVITPGATVVVAPQRESALDVFRAAATAHGARLVEVAAACRIARTAASMDGQSFKLRTAVGSYAATLPLAGRHQLDNAATAIVACEELAARCGFTLTEQHVREGLAAVAWPGRLEVLKRRPLVIADGAHNGDSARRLAAALRDDLGVTRATMLFGTLAGKDIPAMVDAMAPLADHARVAAWPHARAADARALAEAWRTAGVPATAFEDLPQAYEEAAAEAGGGAIVAFGALAFVAALREYLLGIESDIIRLAAGAPPARAPQVGTGTAT